MNPAERTAPERSWDRRRVAAVVRRDLHVLRHSKPVVIPMLIVPVLLLVVIPLGVVWSARLAAAGIAVPSIESMVTSLSPDLAGRVADQPAAAIIEAALVYLLSPMLLIVPVMIASVVAADAIAGERERKTLEGLLLTPLTDGELFAAKLLVAWLPAVAISIAGGIAYAVVVEVSTVGVIDGSLFPNVVWAGLVFWVGPALAAISLGVTAYVSARVKTVQEAFQIAGVVVLPVVGLVISQAAGLFVISPVLLFAGGALAWGLAALVLAAGARAVRRPRLGERL